MQNRRGNITKASRISVVKKSGLGKAIKLDFSVYEKENNNIL
jgi:hypothetical protein